MSAKIPHGQDMTASAKAAHGVIEVAHGGSDFGKGVANVGKGLYGLGKGVGEVGKGVYHIAEVGGVATEHQIAKIHKHKAPDIAKPGPDGLVASQAASTLSDGVGGNPDKIVRQLASGISGTPEMPADAGDPGIANAGNGFHKLSASVTEAVGSLGNMAKNMLSSLHSPSDSLPGMQVPEGVIKMQTSPGGRKV